MGIFTFLGGYIMGLDKKSKRLFRILAADGDRAAAEILLLDALGLYDDYERKVVKEWQEMSDEEIELPDDFKRRANAMFREFFGEDCKVPHPEVE